MVVCIPHREREYLAAATDLGRLRIDATRNCRRSWGPARRAQQLLCRELPHQPGCPRACNSPQQFPGRRLAQLTRRTGARWLSAVPGWTLSLFSIPRNWNRARGFLAALYERAIRDDLPSDAVILSAVM